MKNTKIKYEAPIIFDLASRGKMQGVLLVCQPGSSADGVGDCQTGSVAQGTFDDCQPGSSATSTCTINGSTAGSTCIATGSTASGCTANGSTP